MEITSRNPRNYKQIRIILSVGAIVLNVLLAAGAYHIGLPLYVDTIGTMVVASLCGLFPGIFVSVATSLICGYFNPFSIYYIFIGVLISISTSAMVRFKFYKKVRLYLIFIFVVTVIGGVGGTLVQWLLTGNSQYASIIEVSEIMSERTGLDIFASTMIANTGLNLVDKGFAAVINILVIYFMPADLRTGIWESNWRQKPLKDKDIESFKQKTGNKSLQGRMTGALVVAIVLLSVTISWISVTVSYENTKKEYTENAANAAKLATKVINADKVPDYIRNGTSEKGYTDTKNLLYGIRDAARGVKYLYVIQIRTDGCHVVFDLDAEDTPGYENGEIMAFEEAFGPYLDDLLEGEEIEPIESDDVSGWLVTVYEPVKNSEGKTVCYVGCDVSLDQATAYSRDFIVKAMLILSGFCVMILAFGIWYTRYCVVYPVNSMVKRAKGFAKSSDDQKEMDEKVEKLRELDIRTGDELEELYQAVCRMAVSTDEKMREIRYYADANSRMQNGLIMVMADMVENRDSDTGAHVQKTAEYCRIILKGLRKSGYYTEKLTDKYISDCVMSAPLHDVGKIHIPDAVLNKPGKLTPEEYEIMKTHTTKGKEIMEKAIDKTQGENYLKEARNMAAYHHERWDGKGYPEGLYGEVIPLSARVMAVADVFDALTSARVYKPPFSVEKALEMIVDGSGTQFDAKCVEVFVDSLDEVIEVLNKYQED